MIANLDQVPLSAAAYLAWEEQQELRYEYLDGRVYPRNDILGMTGGTLPHIDSWHPINPAAGGIGRNGVREQG